MFAIKSPPCVPFCVLFRNSQQFRQHTVKKRQILVINSMDFIQKQGIIIPSRSEQNIIRRQTQYTANLHQHLYRYSGSASLNFCHIGHAYIQQFRKLFSGVSQIFAGFPDTHIQIASPQPIVLVILLIININKYCM